MNTNEALEIDRAAAKAEDAVCDRSRVLGISWELMRDMLTAGEHKGCAYRIIEGAIPEDAELIGVNPGSPGVILLTLSSPSFEVVPGGCEGKPITPILEPVQDET